MFLNPPHQTLFRMFETGWMCISPWWSFAHALVVLQAFCRDKSRHERPLDLCSGSGKVMKEATHCARGNAVIIFHLKIVPRLCPMGGCIIDAHVHPHACCRYCVRSAKAHDFIAILSAIIKLPLAPKYHIEDL